MEKCWCGRLLPAQTRDVSNTSSTIAACLAQPQDKSTRHRLARRGVNVYPNGVQANVNEDPYLVSQPWIDFVMVAAPITVDGAMSSKLEWTSNLLHVLILGRGSCLTRVASTLAMHTDRGGRESIRSLHFSCPVLLKVRSSRTSWINTCLVVNKDLRPARKQLLTLLSWRPECRTKISLSLLDDFCWCSWITKTITLLSNNRIHQQPDPNRMMKLFQTMTKTILLFFFVTALVSVAVAQDMGEAEAAARSSSIIGGGGSINCQTCRTGYYDGCNVCSCKGNGLGLTKPGLCTRRYCAYPTTAYCNDKMVPAPAPTVPAPTFIIPDSCRVCAKGYTDGCNDCLCHHGRLTGCTKKACPPGIVRLQRPECF
jgi:hypothetical protein